MVVFEESVLDIGSRSLLLVVVASLPGNFELQATVASTLFMSQCPELAPFTRRLVVPPLPPLAQVYDVTPYLGQHPGGDAILRNAGGDSTKGMHGPQHPAQAMEILEQHFIGLLET